MLSNLRRKGKNLDEYWMMWERCHRRVKISDIDKKSTGIGEGVHLFAGESVRIIGFSSEVSVESLSIVSAGGSV